MNLIQTAEAFPETTRTEPTRYAALSYCWGTGRVLKTTPSNLQEHLRAIEVSSLPLTIQQAVLAARNLGIRYLWIDALCILQREGSERDADALADWQHESVRMHHVYGNAFLTIVASAACHSDQGLMCGDLSMVDAGWYGNSGVPIDQEPLFGRAWALQEWVLSMRLLVFTRRGICYVCHDNKRCVGENTSSRVILVPLYWPSKTKMWKSLVEGLCSRNLAVPGDKLAAISGLAKRIADIRHFSALDYLAGLWGPTLLQDLLWGRPRPYSPHPTLGFNEERSKWKWRNRDLAAGTWKLDYSGRRPGRAPTWSWASIDGNVSSLDFHTDEEDGFFTAEVKYCRVEPVVDGDYFGPVKSGVLVINCAWLYLVVIIDRQTNYLGEEITAWTLCDDGPRGREEVAELWPDDPSEFQASDEPTRVYCLEVYQEDISWNSDKKHRSKGIVVKYDVELNRFLRVGYFLSLGVYDQGNDRWTFGII